MIASLYIAGLLFAATGAYTKSFVAVVAAIYYLTNHPMGLIMGSLKSSFAGYAYFAAVNAAFGIYLFSQGDKLLMLSGLMCFVTAVIIMLASKQAFLGDYFYRNWSLYFGLTHTLTLFPLILYFGGLMKL